jgi:hypothetical protein
MAKLALGAVSEGAAEDESVEMGAASAPRTRARTVTKRTDMAMAG